MCFCVFFFADIQNWSAAKRARLQAFLSKDSQSNESNTVDNNGSNEALPTGSDTRDVTDSGARTQNNNLSDTKKVHSCSRLDRLVNIATELETDEESATHIASNASSNNVSEVEHSNENPNELGEIEELKTVPKEEEDAVTATDIASNTGSNNVSEAKRSNENPNELDETKNRLSDQSNADGNDSNQDDDGVHPNKKTSRSNALAKAAALPKNTGSASVTVTNLFGTSSESESAAEEDDGPHDVAIPYPVVNGKWEYIMCDINQVKKYAENTYIELELRIQTCFYRRGQYQGDVLRLRSEFVFVWHFLCYSFNLLCCPF